MKNRQEWTDWAQKRLARKLATEDFDREVTAIGSPVARTGMAIGVDIGRPGGDKTATVRGKKHADGSLEITSIDVTGCAVPKATGKYPGTPCPYCGKPQ